MFKKTTAAVVLAATALLGATPALADGYRHGGHHGYPQKRVVVVHQQAPYQAHRRHVARRPVVVHRSHHSHDVLGGLIVGAMLGAVIASQAGY